jgi:hypothetical protein
LRGGRSPSSSNEKRYVEKLKIVAPTHIDFGFANDLLVLPQEIDNWLKGLCGV